MEQKEAAGDKNTSQAVAVVENKTPVSFTDLGLSPWLVKNCREMGLFAPTAIQEKCIPPILAGKDVIGSAKTGSGKTAAFALPILQKLAEDPYGIFALVVTPTRELAYQIADQFQALGVTISLKSAIIVGGMNRTNQSLHLSKKPHVVIGTPGRLVDHLDAGELDLRRVQYLVLDEADRLLDKCFAESIGKILGALPQRRQTLLFSATMTNSLKKLEKMAMKETFRFDLNTKYEPVETLKQQYMFMPNMVKDCYLVYLLREFDSNQAIIFTSTCASAQVIWRMLVKLDITASSLHSLLTQKQRNKSLLRFRGGSVRVLVATDVANRGLDIPDVELVINYDVPASTKDYMHRVGRTARIGKKGTAITLVTQYDVDRVISIEKDMKFSLEELKPDEDDILVHLNEARTAKKIACLRLEEAGFWTKAREVREKNREQKKQLRGRQEQNGEDKMEDDADNVSDDEKPKKRMKEGGGGRQQQIAQVSDQRFQQQNLQKMKQKKKEIDRQENFKQQAEEKKRLHNKNKGNNNNNKKRKQSEPFEKKKQQQKQKQQTPKKKAKVAAD